MAYYRVIQISPFLFEDFCCALRSPEQTRLLAEIHIAFIRLFFREDEENQTMFCAQDTNNWLNVMLQLLDGMTYAEVCAWAFKVFTLRFCRFCVTIWRVIPDLSAAKLLRF